MEAGWTRREFLAATNAAALLLLLESCSIGGLGGKSPASSQSSGSLIEQALKDLQQALRASPDHLAYRAQAAAATKDSTKIVNFVRDSLGVIPPWGASDDTGAVRWGGAAALRGAQGTLRERAEILAGLLTQAGFKATVMAADRPTSVDVKAMYRQRAPKFSPDSGKVDAARSLFKEAGLPAARAQQAFAPGPDPAAAILAALPTTLQQARVRTDLLPDVVPVVQFSEGGKTRYAFALGDLGISDSAPAGLRNAGGIDDAPVLTVTVSALAEPAVGSTTPGGRLIDLVSGSWRADKVVGRQVLLTFSPPQGPQAIIDSGLAALPARIPFLRVQTETGAPDPNLIATGSMVTVHGDVLGSPLGPAPSPGTPVAGPYGPYINLSDSDRKAAESRVAAIKVSANAAAFPEVELVMDVTDSSGASVDGLDATSFGVKDLADRPAIAVYSNSRSVQRPRVLVVYDNFVGWWPSPAAKTAFEAALSSALVAQASAKPFDVQVVHMGGVPDAAGWAAPDATQLVNAFAHASESADDPWGTCGGPALDQGVSSILCVSDFNNLDGAANALPTFQHRLISARVPVFAIPAGQNGGQFDAATAAELVSLTHGQTFPATNDGATAAVTAATAALKTWFSPAYRLRYTAAAGGPSHHDVFVALANRAQPVGQTSYEVPAQPIPPPSFAGLYVTISLAGLQSIRRLAGVEVSGRGGPLTATGDSAVIAETRAAMDGVTTIAFEPGSPTASAILDDIVSSLLSVVPVAALPTSATSDDYVKAIKNGYRHAPVTLASLLRETPVDAQSAAGLKVLILQDRPVSPEAAEQHADLAVGVNPVIPLVTDPVAAFRAAVATSVAACAAEAETYPVSAYAALSGASLKPIAANDFAAREAWLTSLTADQQATWRPVLVAYDDFHRLVPADGKAGAMWVVGPDTGVAKAVLLDGTGGAMIRTACKYDAFDSFALTIAMLSVMCSFGGAALFPFWCIGINVVAVGLTVLAYYDINGHKHADPGTAFGGALSLAGLLGQSFLGLEGPIGIILMLITIQGACGGGGAG